MRRLTIGYMYYPETREPNAYPKLQLQGRWLEKLGWEIGTKVEITETPEEIVIRKLTSQENTESSPEIQQ